MQKGGLRLDLRASALKGGSSGQRAIVPHDAAKSLLFQLVASEDLNKRMPPPDSDAPKLSKDEINTLRAWINAGPAWPDELAGVAETKEATWSLRPLVQLSVPNVKETSNPIDAFILDRLRLEGLNPSPEADARTLIRRLSLGLTGLPPTPAEVEAFVRAVSPAAYADLVNRFLDSPHYGEHWARHWLDVAHYADTHGNDHDHARPHAWPYRDWVVRAFNDDKPYGRFVREQVAGDVFYPDDPQALVALGFLAAGPWDETLMVGINEDTVDHRMAQNLDRDDMVMTVMSSFQSLTVHCARCHDHKFDPVSQREYYQLQAVFSGIDRVDIPYDDNAAIHRKRVRLRQCQQAIERRDSAVLASTEAREREILVDRFRERRAKRPKRWRPVEIISVASATGANTKFARLADGSWLATGDVPKQDAYLITASTKVRDIRALRLETLTDPSLPAQGPGRYHPSGNFHLTEFKAEAQPSQGPTQGAVRLEFSRVSEDHGDRNSGADKAVDGALNTHWSVHPRYGQPHEAVFELKQPLDHADGSTLLIRMDFKGHERHEIGRFRISVCDSEMPEDWRPPLPAALIELLDKPNPTEVDRRELAFRILARETEAALKKLPKPKLVYAVASDFKPDRAFKPAITPRPIHVLIRGEIDRHGELVGPGTLSCLPNLPGELRIAQVEDEASRRAALARWLTDRRNVLTWRSIVNRVWSYHFGRGLCDTPNDFGAMGGAPSHPELLDWLAVWFRDEAKGSFKALHRLIVTSAAYRQRVAHSAEAAARDPDNRLLWRMNRRRLSGEQVRDSLLAVSGRLDPAMGGPAVYHFNHKGDATFKPSGGQPAYVDYENFDPDAPANRRRSLYRFHFRTVPDPLMTALDVPDGGQLVPSRTISTTPVQAFALLNNSFVLRQSQHIATRAARAAGAGAKAEACVREAFRLVLQRAPQPEEERQVAAYAAKHGLANAVHLLLNSNEFIYLD